ncbi:MAG: 3-hydroxy-3-methylglutaryl-CoA reductase, partial [Methanothrix sp.]
VHSGARASLKVLGITSADDLGRVLASVGLAQNFAALRALATEGIQRGHMSLHARNVAVQAGATGDEIESVASKMAAERRINVDRARELLRDGR